MQKIDPPTIGYFFLNFAVTPLHLNCHNSYVFWANWKISVPKNIYYSRAFTWYLQNPCGTWHVSRNVSQSLSTSRSKKSKNRNYLVWQSIGSSCRPSQLSENICHPSRGIFYIDWSRWGSVLVKPEPSKQQSIYFYERIKHCRFD